MGTNLILGNGKEKKMNLNFFKVIETFFIFMKL